MCFSLFSIDVSLHDTILVDTNRCEQVEGAFVARINTVKDQADNNLLPCWTALVPEFGLLEVDNVANVLHNTVHGSCSQDLVFVISCDGNEQLGVPVVHGWSQIVSILEREVIGIAGRGSI
jgi:hypothetical protein